MESEIDQVSLMSEYCVLDVDLPMFLDEYRLPDTPPEDQATARGFGDVVDESCEVKSSSVHEICKFDDANNFYLFPDDDDDVSLCWPGDDVSLPVVPVDESAAVWQENFIDFEGSPSYYFAEEFRQQSVDDVLTQVLIGDAFLTSVGNCSSVDHLLDIVEEAGRPSESLDQVYVARGQEEILEEIYRECEQIETLSGAGSPPAPEYSISLTVDGVPIGINVDDEYGSATSPEGSATDEESTSWIVEKKVDHTFAAQKSKIGKTSKRGNPIKKKSQNREAAHRYRSKRKVEKEVVESEVSILTTRNDKLKSVVDDLQREIAYLKNFLSVVREASAKKK